MICGGMRYADFYLPWCVAVPCISDLWWALGPIWALQFQYTHKYWVEIEYVSKCFREEQIYLLTFSMTFLLFTTMTNVDNKLIMLISTNSANHLVSSGTIHDMNRSLLRQHGITRPQWIKIVSVSVTHMGLWAIFELFPNDYRISSFCNECFDS